MTISDEEVYAYLEHHGIKGQKWGVRKQQTSNESNKSGGWSNKKKAAVILGSAAVAAGLIVGGVYAKKHFGVKTSDIKGSSETAKKFAQSLAKEPVAIVHSSRGHSKGFHFLQRGGLDNPLKELERAGVGDSTPVGTFKRYGDNLEKVYASFHDPLGRKDAAGRLIPHEVFLPESLAKGVNNHDEAVKKAWPLIKDTYDAMYKSSIKKF